ncbi:hypothetical protein E1286_25935 [Nonomuraea terrae]|uniref:Thioredoxin domain-containing protein n=1 Tax=Nonomuraea terrae TaxID=2530383 RepID=A0A4R4YIT1_9ACTN|nr:hypothetical protein E1286_25935 [Nonomuraea terrae]
MRGTGARSQPRHAAEFRAGTGAPSQPGPPPHPLTPQRRLTHARARSGLGGQRHRAELRRARHTGERPVLIQFWATWCRPCRMVTPIVESLAADRSGVYAGGRPVGSRTGAPPKQVLDQHLTSILRDGGVDR